MSKLNVKKRIVIIPFMCLLLLGSFGGSSNNNGLTDLRLTSAADLQADLLGSIDEQTGEMSQGNSLNPAIHSSGIITEDSVDFLTGTMDNLIINDKGYLSLEKENVWLDSWNNITGRKPSARTDHAMVYDSDSARVILFGGNDVTGHVADTWVYDLAANSWTQMNPLTKPSKRIGHSMVYDSNSGKVILFGGWNSTDYLADTWIYDLPANSWTQMNPINPPSTRMLPSMAYDSSSNQVILFGGSDSPTSYFADTWIYDLSANNWTQMNPVNPPSARDAHSMVYDSNSDKVILFGGRNDSALTAMFGDTWAYDLTANSWTQMNPVNPPSARIGHSMVYNSNYTQTMVFGGTNSSGYYLADTWLYDLTTNSWTQMNPSTKPDVRTSFSMVYESNFKKVILFGGGQGITRLADTWVYDLTANSWAQMNTLVKPSARDLPSMVYDSDSDKVMLFGGRNGSSMSDLFGDTWVYDLTANSWTQMNPINPPDARAGHSMVYDSNSGKIILFGGTNSTFDYLADTWVYDLPTNSWTQMNPLTKPDVRTSFSMVYDSNFKKVILFGGGQGITRLADTWVYDLTANSWTQMNPLNSPSARTDHVMVYDSNSMKMILFGGSDAVGHFEDTWIYDLITNSWTQMNPLAKPSKRIGHSMVYDSNSDQVILFGGWNGTDFFADTWIYYLKTNSWTQMNPVNPPSARNFHSMVYDPNSDRSILFGGSDSPTSYFADTWIYPGNLYYRIGMFESKLTYLFGDIHKIKADFTWKPSTQPKNTILELRVGLSNTTKDEDFIYTDYHAADYLFEGVARYLRYNAIFASDLFQYSSPILKQVNIYYSLEKITSVPQGVPTTSDTVPTTSIPTTSLPPQTAASTFPGVLTVLVILSTLVVFIRRRKRTKR